MKNNTNYPENMVFDAVHDLILNLPGCKDIYIQHTRVQPDDPRIKNPLAYTPGSPVFYTAVLKKMLTKVRWYLRESDDYCQKHIVDRIRDIETGKIVFDLDVYSCLGNRDLFSGDLTETEQTEYKKMDEYYIYHEGVRDQIREKQKVLFGKMKFTTLLLLNEITYGWAPDRVFTEIIEDRLKQPGLINKLYHSSKKCTVNQYNVIPVYEVLNIMYQRRNNEEPIKKQLTN
jgi:hypothetical protein